MQLIRTLVRTFSCLQDGQARRVVFYYHNEDPTYLEDAHVRIFRNGMVEVVHKNEKVSTHIQNVEILWRVGSSSVRTLSLVKGGANRQT